MYVVIACTRLDAYYVWWLTLDGTSTRWHTKPLRPPPPPELLSFHISIHQFICTSARSNARNSRGKSCRSNGQHGLLTGIHFIEVQIFVAPLTLIGTMGCWALGGNDLRAGQSIGEMRLQVLRKETIVGL